MKRIAVSVGLVVVGATVVQAGPADSLSSMQASKPWSLSAALRGFYDDNYALDENNTRSSYGFEVRPSVTLNLPLEQTLITGSYTYSLKYYEDRDRGNSNLCPIDQAHIFNVALTHAFSERYTIDVRDSLVAAQEPSLIDPNLSFVGRANANTIRNTGSATFQAELTPVLNGVLGYQNTLYDYEDSVRAALLDRLEHQVKAEARWKVLPTTTAVGGYLFGMSDYTGSMAIAPGYVSSDRNVYSHTGYVGVDHAFTEALTGSVNVGAQYYDYYNTSEDSIAPYAEANLSYNYAPGSFASIGFRHSRNATDQLAADSSGKITLDQETSVAFASVNHQFTEKLKGSLTGQVQGSTFNKGAANDKTDMYYSLGLDLSYAFNPHVSADVGYMFDNLDSDIALRSYTRNRVYIGVTATY